MSKRIRSMHVLFVFHIIYTNQTVSIRKIIIEYIGIRRVTDSSAINWFFGEIILKFILYNYTHILMYVATTSCGGRSKYIVYCLLGSFP